MARTQQIVIGRFEHEAEASAVATRLEAAGIATVIGRTSSPVLSGIQGISIVELAVAAADVARSVEILGDEAPDPDAEKECPTCGETSPASFSQCWSCAASLELTPSRPRIETAEGGPDIEPREGFPGPTTLARHVLTLEVFAMLLVAWAPIMIGTLFTSRSTSLLTLREILGGLPIELGIVALVVYLLQRDTGCVETLGLKSVHWGREFLWALAIVALLTSARFFVVLLSLATGIPFDPLDAASYSTSPHMIWGLAVWFVSGALFEEVLFRGYLIPRFTDLMKSRKLAVVVSSALFAIYHGYSAAATLDIFVMGILLGVIFLRSRRLPRLVLAHLLFNFTLLAQ